MKPFWHAPTCFFISTQVINTHKHARTHACTRIKYPFTNLHTHLVFHTTVILHRHSNIINNLFVFSGISTCWLPDHPSGWNHDPHFLVSNRTTHRDQWGQGPERMADPRIWGITEGHILLSGTFMWSNLGHNISHNARTMVWLWGRGGKGWEKGRGTHWDQWEQRGM